MAPLIRPRFFLEACATGVSGLAIMSDCECDITRNSVARPRPHMGLSPVLENEGPSEARRVLFTVGDLMLLKETEYAWARLSAVLHKDDSLHVVHVETAESVEVSSHRGGVVFPVFNDRKEPRRKWLPSFCDLTPFKDHRVLLLKSRPGVTVEQAILRYIEEFSIDLVVMASRDLSTAARLLCGSTTSEVVRLSSCPVMVIRRPFFAVQPPPKPAHPGRRSIVIALAYQTPGESMKIVTWAITNGILLTSDDVVIVSAVKHTSQKAKARSALVACCEAVSAHKAKFQPNVEPLVPQVLIGEFAGSAIATAVAAAGAVSFLICGSTKTGLSRLLGSVSSYFIQNATCPVIVVRDQGNL